MATPSSGAISMLNMRDEITRGSGAISMSEVRARYGTSGSISFGDLYKTEGFTVACSSGEWSFKGSTIYYRGWMADTSIINPFGSVSPGEVAGYYGTGANSYLQFAANSNLGSVYASSSDSNATFSNTILGFHEASNYTSDGTLMTSGYQTTNITRVVVANTSRSFAAVSNTTQATAEFSGYTPPTSGTIHCLVKF